ncbi:MAG TPA: DUF4382 domain-containing protein [Longimicrobiales bacterium]
MARRTVEYVALALALALPLAACEDDPGTSADTARVSLLLTDAAGDFEAAVVTISKVYLQGQGGEFVLMEGEETTDLLTLANDVATLAEDVTVPAGVYTQLRFVIDGAYVEVDNGDGTTRVYATADYAHVPEGVEVDGELHCPSCGVDDPESGLKVNLPGGTRIEGEQKILLVDFDVAQSFEGPKTGKGDWVLNPVIKASELELTSSVVASLALADSVELPSIGGTVLTLGNFRARLTNADGSSEELALVDGDGDSVFEAEFQYLIPGDYTVEFVTDADVSFTLDLDSNPTELSVGSGQRAEVAAVVTSAN